VRCAFLLAALTQLSTLNPQPCAAATSTTNALICESNLAYEREDLGISGAGVTVAIDGPHAFNSPPGNRLALTLASRRTSANLLP
jgi:hypothetical protein